MWADNETEEDLLGFEVHANLIQNLVKDEGILPTTIGVFGDWGSGKSSIMKILNKNLKESDRIIPLYFNGWVFEGYDDAKAALIESILKQLKDNTLLKEDIKDKIKNLLSKIDYFRLAKLGFKGAMAFSSSGMTLIPDLINKIQEATENPEKLGNIKLDGIKELLKNEKKEKESIKFVREFREEFAKTINAIGDKVLVIMIDDLDRCSPERIIDSLEAIKLFLNVEKTAFVIGADPRIVEHAIELKYSNISTDNANIKQLSKDYLEKIIQLPYNLPKLSDIEVKTYLSLLFSKKYLDENTFKNVISKFKEFREKDRYSYFNLNKLEISIPELLQDQLKILPQISLLVTKNLKGNPRQIKRFLNAFLLRKKLAEVSNLTSDFNDSVLVKLMVLEYMDLDMFKKIYQWQVEQNGYSKELEEIENGFKEGEKLNSEYAKWETDIMRIWITSEPSLSRVDLRDYFWLSRDKLESTIDSSTLIPPIVKQVYSSFKNAASNRIKINILENLDDKIDSTNLEFLYKYILQEFNKDNKEDKNYEFIIYLVKYDKNGAIDILMEMLNKSNVQNLKAHLATELLQIKHKSNLIENFINETLKKDSSSKFAKALKE
ncbi:MAG: hypothetical protein KA157_08620 [Aliarcobacter sp.]|nr:hypothetical protein [Aliarcobacter sp.]